MHQRLCVKLEHIYYAGMQCNWVHNGPQNALSIMAVTYIIKHMFTHEIFIKLPALRIEVSLVYKQYNITCYQKIVAYYLM